MMKKDAQSSYLNKRELEAINNVTFRKPDEDLTFDKVFYIHQVINPNAKADVYNLANDDEGVATLVNSLTQSKKIFVSGDEVSYSIYKPALGFELEMDDVEASRVWGRPLDTEVIERATRGVNEKLNNLAWVGDSEFNVPGLISASGITTIVGADIDGMTDISSSFIGYFNSLPKRFRNQYDYSLTLATQEWAKLQKRGNTFNDKSVQQILLDSIPRLKAIYEETNLTAGTELYDGSTVAEGIAYYIPYARQAVFMPLAKSPRSTSETGEANRIIKGNVYARAGPVAIPYPTSIGKITTLNG